MDEDPLPSIVPCRSPHPACEYGYPGDCTADALYKAQVTCGCYKLLCYTHLKLIGDHIDAGGWLKCETCESCGLPGRGLSLDRVTPLKTGMKE